MTGFEPAGEALTGQPGAERDAALLAMLPHVALRGWTVAALRQGLIDLGEPADAAALLFQGPLDMIEAYLDFADRRMSAAAAGMTETRVSGRVRALIALRLHQAEAERPAVRRAAAVLALPMHAPKSARALARTVDAIWQAAGDQSADFNWYTKRATLAAVYSATLMHWLRFDAGSDWENAQTLAFLDRRLADVARLGKLQARLSERLGAFLPARWQENPPTRATLSVSPDAPPVCG